jgi:hypothetical protein
MSTEKRKTPRYAVKLEVYWERPSGMQLVKMTDLSLGGCFIKAFALPAVGSQVNLEIRLPSGRWLYLSGIVVRSQAENGFAIHFTPELEGHVMDLINPQGGLRSQQ